MSKNFSILSHFDFVKLSLLSSILLLTCQAQARDNDFYVGFAYGRVVVDRNVEDFDDGSITSGRVDRTDSGWKLNIGYYYNPYFAVDFGRVELNNDLDSATSFTGQSNGTGNQYAAGEVSVDIRNPVAYYLAAVGRLPMPLGPPPYGNRLALVGKIGITSWSATKSVTDSNGRTEQTKDGNSLLGGLAIEYQWQNGIAIRSGIEYYRDIIDEQYEFHNLELIIGF